MRLVLDAPSADSESMSYVTQSQNNIYTNVLNIEQTVLLDQTALKSAKPSTDALGQSVIDIIFTKSGTKRFAEVTRSNIHKRLAIIINGQVCEVAIIQTEISDGVAQISGGFSKQEVKYLAGKINDALANN
jgi:preprotein translocase subunit SecD